MSTNSVFGHIENKHNLYRRKDSMKKIYEYAKKYN